MKVHVEAILKILSARVPGEEPKKPTKVGNLYRIPAW